MPGQAAMVLQLLAAKLEEDGHPVAAIKCLLACLSKSLMPGEEAHVKLHIGRLMLHHTHNSSEALRYLQQAVSLLRPGLSCISRLVAPY
jgi:hypothetical protein